jgi:hypothetical protein
LESARVYIRSIPDFKQEFLRSFFRDKSLFGTSVELVIADFLLKSFTSCSLEYHPLLQATKLPESFNGLWTQPDFTLLYGQIATCVSTSVDFYKYAIQPILFPDQKAGPDIIIKLKNPKNILLTIFVQVKARDYINPKIVIEGLMIQPNFITKIVDQKRKLY